MQTAVAKAKACIILTTDTTRPVITLIGPEIVYLEEFRQYTDSGATALDDTDGNITDSIKVTGFIDSSYALTQYLYFNVKDAAGNNALEKRRTVVVFADTSKPEIKLIGDSLIYVEVFESYTELGATGTDHVDLQVFIQIIGTVDTAVTGTYFITYAATDTRNNTGTNQRKVIVRDTTKPEIYLVGQQLVKIPVFTGFVDSGVVFTDNYCVEDTGLKVFSSLDTSKPGNYVIEYQITDCEGNTASITRIVHVIDAVRPQIQVISEDTVFLEVFSAFTDPQIIVTDNVDSALSYRRIGFVNNFQLGFNKLSYYAVDNSGNHSDTVHLIVEVVDDTPPQIILNGKTTDTVLRWKPYFDLGVNKGDNYDRNPKTIFGGTFQNTDLPGNYFRTYTVVDQSGNSSNTLVRNIIVVNDTLTSIEKNRLNFDLAIYPNPAKSYFILNLSIEKPANFYLTLTDAAGKQMFFINQKQLTSFTEEISLENYSTGVYFLTGNVGNVLVKQKVVVIE